MERRCAECGTPMGAWERGDVPYRCGLPNITLRNVEVATCPKCGAWDLRLPNVSRLHETIAQAVAQKAGRLSAEEVRFLRKHLGWSGRDFAEAIGYRPETVSRWEHGHAEIPVVVDRLLRAYALLGKPVGDYAEHDSRQATPMLVLETDPDGWEVSAA